MVEEDKNQETLLHLWCGETRELLLQKNTRKQTLYLIVLYKYIVYFLKALLLVAIFMPLALWDNKYLPINYPLGHLSCIQYLLILNIHSFTLGET